MGDLEQGIIKYGILEGLSGFNLQLKHLKTIVYTFLVCVRKPYFFIKVDLSYTH